LPEKKLKKMENSNAQARFAGSTLIAGAVAMLIGAALWGSTGADLWQTLDSGDMAAYLRAVADVRPQLVANTCFWVIGVLLMGLGGNALAAFSTHRHAPAQAAALCFRTAVPLAIISFLTMLSLAMQIAPDSSPTAIAIANVAGWIGTRADDIATALLIGAGPLFLSLAGRGHWAPGWLVRWGYLAGLAGLLAIGCLFFPGMVQFSFIIIPVGIGWLFATGVVLLRRRST